MLLEDRLGIGSAAVSDIVEEVLFVLDSLDVLAVVPVLALDGCLLKLSIVLGDNWVLLRLRVTME